MRSCRPAHHVAEWVVPAWQSQQQQSAQPPSHSAIHRAAALHAPRGYVPGRVEGGSHEEARACADHPHHSQLVAQRRDGACSGAHAEGSQALAITSGPSSRRPTRAGPLGPPVRRPAPQSLPATWVPCESESTFQGMQLREPAVQPVPLPLSTLGAGPRSGLVVSSPLQAGARAPRPCVCSRVALLGACFGTRHARTGSESWPPAATMPAHSRPEQPLPEARQALLTCQSRRRARWTRRPWLLRRPEGRWLAARGWRMVSFPACLSSCGPAALQGRAGRGAGLGVSGAGLTLSNGPGVIDACGVAIRAISGCRRSCGAHAGSCRWPAPGARQGCPAPCGSAPAPRS
jgi:hypothetical protein